ncbi:unnamed protein product [Onchocerca flexuosa]|uniref:Uncharacterized protein n=1 Tax=Onchocerca flexuosa TaxID=387005 RepID=A0A183H2X3_9BILA|nr:unnamed protein product [Onchocerca flexuosa]
MAYNFYEMQQCNNEIANNVRYEPNAVTTINIDNEAPHDWDSPSSYFELNNSTSLDSRIHEAGYILKQTMELRDPRLISDRKGHLQVFFFSEFENSFAWKMSFHH